MGYSNFRNIKSVVKKFDLDAVQQRLFVDIVPVNPSSWLQETLSLLDILPLTNEKSKAERIISPILSEIARHYSQYVSFYSGEALNIKPDDDLAGECDFFFALHPPKPYLDAPIISLVEAKAVCRPDEDMEWGIAQCAAQMLGAKMYNDGEGKSLKTIYGCATDGLEWHFLKLENNVYHVDNKIMTDLPLILGTLHRIIQSYL